MKRLGTLLFVSFSLSFLIGCFDQDLEFSVRYQEVNGLNQGSSLVHDETVIGRVDEVVYTERGDFEVQVTIDEPHVALATDTALFVVASGPAAAFAGSTGEAGSTGGADPLGDRKPVIELITDAQPGQPIADGAMVEGSTALSGFAQELQNQFSTALGDSLGATLMSLAESVEQSVAALKEQNIDEYIALMDSELDRLLNEAETLSDSALQSLRNDILPRIKQSIEQLKQYVEGMGKEESIDQIEQKMIKLDGALAA